MTPLQAQADAQGLDSRQFSIEKGRLRMASVSRQNPLSADAFNNPMYHEGTAGFSEYDAPSSTPMAVNPLFRNQSFGESATDPSYDQAGHVNGWLHPIDSSC